MAQTAILSQLKNSSVKKPELAQKLELNAQTGTKIGV